MKFITGFVAVILLASCGSRSSDETQVRELIDAVELAAESRDASDVVEHVTASYSDSNGFDRTQLERFLRGYFLANPKIELLVRIETLEFPVEGLGRARLHLDAIPSGDHVSVDVEFRHEDGDWRIARADRVRP
jgi:hypothetical protein